MKTYMQHAKCSMGISAGAFMRLLQTNICEYAHGAHTSQHNWVLGATEFTSPPSIAYIVSHLPPFTKTAVVVPEGVGTVKDFLEVHPPPAGMKYIVMPVCRDVPYAHSVSTYTWEPCDDTRPFPLFYSGSVLVFFPVPEASTRYIECLIGNARGANKAHVMIPVEERANTYLERQDVVERAVTGWMLDHGLDPFRFQFGRHTNYSASHDTIIKVRVHGEYAENPVVELPGAELVHAVQYVVDVTRSRASSRSYRARDARDTIGDFLEYFDGKCHVTVDEHRFVCVDFKVKMRDGNPYYDTYSTRFIREDFMPFTTNRKLYESELQRMSGHVKGDFRSASEFITDNEEYLAIMVDNVSRVTYTHPASYDDDHACRRAVDTVRRYDWLYRFQKETVEDMIRREYSGDGIMGMINTRLDGKVGDEGVFFLDGDYRRLTSEGRSVLRIKGGILADEPGLGKTRQSIALIRAVQTAERAAGWTYGWTVESQRRSGATIVVVKPNVLRQWREEIEKLWRDCRLAVYHGANKRSLDIDRLRSDYDVVLTTYTTYVTSDELHEPWRRAMFDESHDMSPRVVHNHTVSNVKWCITGTPVKGLNRMVAFLFGGILRAFGQITQEVLNVRAHGKYYMRQLVLRKTLSKCVNFPPVPITDVVVRMTDDERTVYDRVRNRVGAITECSIPVVYQRYAGLVNVANFGTYASDIPMTNFSESDGGRIAIDERVGHPPEDDLCPICIDTYDDPCVTGCGHWFCSECMLLSLDARSSCPMCRASVTHRSVRKRPRDTTMDDVDEPAGPGGSGVSGTKVSRIMTYIQDALRDDGRKIIVFFPSKFMVDTFCEDAAVRGISVGKVHGQVSMSRRQKTFSEFQDPRSSCRVIAATIKTMSDGITLTMATDILISTPTGRNAIDSQIIGRANRIGRDLSKPLNIVRYVYAGTVEEKYLQMQIRHGSVGSRIVDCFY